MVRCVSKFFAFFCLLSSLAFADESENERRWNTPPKLTPEPADGKSNPNNESIQPRFLPFSASFSLSSGGLANNAHSLSVGGGEDGISFSQSSSQAGNSFGNVGSGISASQSSSFAAGLSGISGADSNAFSLTHPTFGDNSQANSNSFALGQATSSSQGHVVNGQAISGAQSGIGSTHSSANSGADSSAGILTSGGQGDRLGRPGWTNIAPNYQVGGLYNPNGGRPKLHVTQGSHGWTQNPPRRGPIRLNVNVGDDRWQHRRPEVFISAQRPGGYRGQRQQEGPSRNHHFTDSSVSESHKNWAFDQGPSSGHRESWTQSPALGPHPGMWSQAQNENKPGLHITGVSASSSSSSNGPGGSAQGHSSSHSSLGPNGPFSMTNNKVQSFGNAQGQAQGAAAAVGQNFNGATQGSFSSGAIAGNSQGNGNSHGNAVSGNRGQNSWGQVTSQSTGNSFVQGTANAGSISYVKFPGDEHPQNLPREFVRSQPSLNSRNNQRRKMSRNRDPVGEIFTEITDTVADIFDI